MANYSRRRFLEDSMLAAAAAAASSAGGNILAADADQERQSKSAGERLSVAIVGVNGRGSEHIGAYTKRDDTEITYIVDPDEKVGAKRAEEIGKQQGRKPKFVKDLRKMLEDNSVDIVTTATPNHWHALVSIWAMQAGKDVYVEKPVSHNVSEGRRIVETARKYGRMCQTGTQSRSHKGMRDMIEAVRSGKIGEVKLARGLCYKPRGSIGPRGNYQVPLHIDYDLWCGPAAQKPLERKNLHYDWHWTWEYGNGDLGNQGIHHMDVARWGLGTDSVSSSVFSYGGRYGYIDAGETANTQVIVHEFGDDKTLVFEVRGLKTDDYKGAKVGTIFYGSEGYIVNPNYYSGGSRFDKDGKKIEDYKGEGDAVHHANFIKAVRSRKIEDLNGDIEEGHLSSALCHLGNISYLLGQRISASETRERLGAITSREDVQGTFDRTVTHLKENGVDVDTIQIQLGDVLKIDPETEKFVGNSQADALLTREYRAPYVVPGAGAV